MMHSPRAALYAYTWACAGACAVLASGCLDARYAGPGHSLTFTGATGRFGGRLPPLLRELSPLENETYAKLRVAETPDILLRAALLAGGISDPDELKIAEAAARAGFETIRPLVESQPDPTARARALLTAMHTRLLRTYAVDQTYLHILLDGGVYNCVSASLLYNVYAGWLGSPSGVSLLPSHARTWVDVGGRRVEVETTTADGFDPHLPPDRMRAFLELRALGGEFREQPTFKPNAALVAIVIANRIAFAHDGVAGTSADRAVQLSAVLVALGLRASALDPDDRIAWRNQVARLDRLALLVVSKGHYVEGAALQRTVAALSGDHGEAADRVRNNVAWAAERRMADAKGDVAEIGRALADARQIIDCERRGALCEKLEVFARSRGLH